jgi:hypothetical protein
MGIAHYGRFCSRFEPGMLSSGTTFAIEAGRAYRPFGEAPLILLTNP